jgi:hypothetical protein
MKCPIQTPGKFKMGMLTLLVAKRMATGTLYMMAPVSSHSQNLLLLRVAVTASRKPMLSNDVLDVKRLPCKLLDKIIATSRNYLGREQKNTNLKDVIVDTGNQLARTACFC